MKEPFLSKSSEQFIGLPILAVFILLGVSGGMLRPPIQGLIWTIGFSLVAARCLWHSWHCGRLECLVTGPLYSVLAILSALHTSGVAFLSWGTIWMICYVGTGLAFLGGFLLSSKLGTRYLKGMSHFNPKSTITIWSAVTFIAILSVVLLSRH